MMTDWMVKYLNFQLLIIQVEDTLFELISKKLLALAAIGVAIAAVVTIILIPPVQQEPVFFQPKVISPKTAPIVNTSVGPGQTLSVSFEHVQDRKTSFDFSYFENVTLDCNTHELVRGEQPTVRITDSQNQTVREMERFYFYLGCPRYPEIEKLEKNVEFFGLAIIMSDQPSGTYNAVIHNPQDNEMHVSYQIDLTYDELLKTQIP
jgi:hypothetical protein